MNDIDAIHEKLDKLRPRLEGLCLDYNKATKKWKIYEKCT